ncbi:MAG: hypothetical protein J4F36_14540 [Nitrosopumilaceae archaeon]|nr:hypothetical protein [Nitrosopumilaceae archaeon]
MASIVIFVVVLAKDLAFDIHSYLFSRDGLDMQHLQKEQIDLSFKNNASLAREYIVKEKI